MQIFAVMFVLAGELQLVKVKAMLAIYSADKY